MLGTLQGTKDTEINVTVFILKDITLVAAEGTECGQVCWQGARVEMHTRQPGRGPQPLVLHDDVLSSCDKCSAFRPCCQKYGTELNTQVWVAAFHHLLLVSWLPAHLSLLSLLPPFLSHLSCVLLGVSRPAAVLVCLSGMNGSTLWSTPLPEEARDVTCMDLMPGSVAETICLVTGTHKMLSVFNATSGKDHLPQKISALRSHNLRPEQSGGEGTFPVSCGGKSEFLLWKVDIKGSKRNGLRRLSNRSTAQPVW